MMTRKQREDFVRSQIYSINSWENAVQTIVDKWESDCVEVWEEAIHVGQESTTSR